MALRNVFKVKDLVSRHPNRVLFNQHYRHESIIASTILKHSPYEELKVMFDPKSSEDNPMKINAFGDERTIACICDDMRFMTLKKGPPTKCKCGYWFQLVDAKKFWEQKPGS